MSPAMWLAAPRMRRRWGAAVIVQALAVVLHHDRAEAVDGAQGGAQVM